MASQKLDFSFDGRVSGQYDRQRQHPPEVSAHIGQFVAELLPSAAEVLELGIGTGRIALPVVAAGCRVTGIDVSAAMLSELQAASVGSITRPSLVRGDISRLPFSDCCFDAVTAVHVLHLVADWEQALASALRVLRPGGRLLLGRDWIDPESMAGKMQGEFRRVVLELMGPQLKAPTGGQTISGALVRLGAEAQHMGADELVAAQWQAELSPTDILNAIRERRYAESWVLPDEMLGPVDERMRHYAISNWSDLDASQPVPRRFVFAVYQRAG